MFTPDYNSPPSDTIKDLLNEKGIDDKEFARLMEIQYDSICLLLSGEVPITYNVAVRLEHVLGSTAEFWVNREIKYRQRMIHG
jgi:HTH-type transcriptional regulator/antitoxin HigA